MDRGGYKNPTKTEMLLRKRLSDVQARIELFLADAAGSAVIKDLEAKVESLEREVSLLESVKVKNANLTKKNEELTESYRAQKKQIASLGMDLKIAHSYGSDLERKLAQTEKRRFEWATFARKIAVSLSEERAKNRTLQALLRRNPQNSSLPPSASPIKKVHNSRMVTGRKCGGQPGHEGHRRKQHTPDETITLPAPVTCPDCGGHLKASGDVKKRRLTDIVITLRTIEFSAEGASCEKCGQSSFASFPKGVLNEQNYGNNIRAVATYLVNRCNISALNCTDFLYEATGKSLKLSTGSVRNFLSGFSEKANAPLQDIEKTLKESPVIASDATHTRSSGKQTYVYTFNSPNAVIYKPSPTKGIKPLQNSPIADYGGIIAHDHDTSYYRFGGGHAECNVHILRALKGVAENEPERTWATQMATLLNEANEAVKEMCEGDTPALDGEVTAAIEFQYKKIIECAKSEYERDGPFSPKYLPEGIALYRRLEKYCQNHLAFLYDRRIPFNNNVSERMLRRVKMKTKQSGGFRSMAKGQSPYCDFLSITQTASVRGMEIFGVVREIFDGNKELFKQQEDDRSTFCL